MLYLPGTKLVSRHDFESFPSSKDSLRLFSSGSVALGFGVGFAFTYSLFLLRANSASPRLRGDLAVLVAALPCCVEEVLGSSLSQPPQSQNSSTARQIPHSAPGRDHACSA